MKKKIIGILGGMGPEASANIYKNIIKVTQQKYGATQDSEYPPVLLYSLPIDGFDEEGVKDADLVKKQLMSAVQRLEQAGSDFIIIACNTVHVFYEEMQSAISIPILNIVEHTAKYVSDRGLKYVGVLSSSDTRKTGLYQTALERENVKSELVSDIEQKELDEVILHVMGGRQNDEDVIKMKNIILNLSRKGVDAVVLGCTELPLAINQIQTDVILIDSNKVIAEVAVDKSLAGE